MFKRNKNQIIKYLKFIRQKICTYAGLICDCKYGIQDKNGSEQTGCPEMRDVISLLRVIPSEIFILKVEKTHYVVDTMG